MARAFRPEGAVLGLGLMAVGVLWMLANLGRIDMLGTLRTYWPLLLVVWGGLELAATLARRAR